MISKAKYQELTNQAQQSKINNLCYTADKFNENHNLLISLFSAQSQVIAKTASSALKKHTLSITKSWLNGTDLLTLSQTYDIPIALIYRAILLQLPTISLSRYKNIESTGIIPFKLPSKGPTQVLMFPECLIQVSTRLCEDAFRSLYTSDMFSPYVNRIRHQIGNDFEYILWQRLFSLEIPFIVDADMRAKNQVKTPDARLLVPVNIFGHSTNWIESKAMFGDFNTFQTHLVQMKSYLLRFGSGIIIYWRGFIDSLNTTANQTKLLTHNRLQAVWSPPSSNISNSSNNSSSHQRVSSYNISIHSNTCTDVSNNQKYKDPWVNVRKHSHHLLDNQIIDDYSYISPHSQIPAHSHSFHISNSSIESDNTTINLDICSPVRIPSTEFVYNPDIFNIFDETVDLKHDNVTIIRDNNLELNINPSSENNFHLNPHSISPLYSNLIYEDASEDLSSELIPSNRVENKNEHIKCNVSSLNSLSYSEQNNHTPSSMTASELIKGRMIFIPEQSPNSSITQEDNISGSVSDDLILVTFDLPSSISPNNT